ncbi:EamA family transporter RarD [Salinarimonas ramus]|uniref:Permease n=1 Tax=Salinarimonas ramus TaxID=690164 RepID=A0A917QBH5_9HYPH|nr:EamA family transporter RarD [Salinarimonas ramus]GGK42363.1 permease [Salinarimonas ramus]
MAAPRSNEDTSAGIGFAVMAYFFWGFLPLYMKALAHVPPLEVVAHRVLWSVPVAGAILLATGRTGDLAMALRSPRTLAMAALTAALISVNWGVYVWAIGAGLALDVALGYYINPLFSVFLGATLLGERPSPAQMVAIALAVIAVAILVFESGRVPIATIAITLSWGAYAFFKKWLPVGPNQGFLLEVLILTPFALALLAVIALAGESHFFTGSAADGWLLVGTGAVTAVPLILFAYGAKGLKLSTIGILQYIAPTMIFLTAVFVFGETFGRAERIAFPLIWAALVVYSISLLHRSRAHPRRP